ncbi:hypothetical protein [Nocardioides jensenii]|uniref:hypothetical protein n=1 Tax=Nocardioides jensenii TaxID=1843 RepID=UPI0008348550|nr:hypothetical protein [Nocardioides jensenii]
MLKALVAVAIATPFAVGAAVADPGPVEQAVCAFTDPAINESSGLVVRDDTMLTVNDSGDTARVFLVDRDDCSTTSQVAYPGGARDVEAIAPAARGERAVWVADIGDNRHARHDLVVVRVPFDGSATERYPVSWQGGPQDAETLMVHPVTGRLYTVTKGVLGGQVLRGPATLDQGGNVFKPVGETRGLITDGAFFPDGKHFLLRNYDTAYLYDTAAMTSLGDFDLPSQQQGEGLAIGPDGRIYLSSEGVHAPVLRIRLPAGLQQALDGDATAEGDASKEPEEDASAGPGSDRVTDGHSPDQSSDQSSEEDSDPDPWPWIIGGMFGLGAVVVLLRALRPR